MGKRSEIVTFGEKQNKKVLFAFIIAVFGILLFIALALTLPWNG